MPTDFTTFRRADLVTRAGKYEAALERIAAAVGVAMPEHPSVIAQRVEELVEAARPFRQAAAHLNPGIPDDGVTLDGIAVGQWRALAARVPEPAHG